MHGKPHSEQRYHHFFLEALEDLSVEQKAEGWNASCLAGYAGRDFNYTREACKDCPHPSSGPPPWVLVVLSSVLLFVTTTLVITETIENQHIRYLQNEFDELKITMNQENLKKHVLSGGHIMNNTILDDHGQPLNRAYGKKRLNDRAIDELIGLSRGLTADGAVNQSEAEFLLKWMEDNSSYCQDPLVNQLYFRKCNCAQRQVSSLFQSRTN